MKNLRRENVRTRHLTPFELRQVLEMEKRKNIRLRQENKELKKEVERLSEWNLLWQKQRWNEEMAKQCEGLEKEIGSLSNNQTTILLHLASAQGRRAERHVRGIARATKLNVATVSKDLKVLQRMKLVRAYLRNSNKKKFHTLPCAKDFIQKHLAKKRQVKFNKILG